MMQVENVNLSSANDEEIFEISHMTVTLFQVELVLFSPPFLFSVRVY